MKISTSSQAVLLLGFLISSSAFCPDGDFLHPTEIAGYACFKDGVGILCDSNKDPYKKCTKERCELQLGGYEEYNCEHARYHYEESGDSEDLLEYWIHNCCFVEKAVVNGCLSGKVGDFPGSCTYDNVVSTAASLGCSEVELISYVKASNSSEARSKTEEMCADALAHAHDSFYQFSDIAKAGYQFDREFMNGGSEWNNAFNPDLSRIQWMEDNVKQGITFPDYLYNFDTEESCELKAAMCCWTSDSSDAGDGSCTDPAGCQDAEPLDNTDICYVNIEDSPLASHTPEGVVVFPGDSEGSANCMGFTWVDDDKDHSSLYKGNLLFEVAMRYGLKDNGYTRSVPHAPMCACVEQMPVVSKADCKDVEGTDNWSFSPDPESGLLSIRYSHADLIFNDCGGQDLAAYYSATHGTSIAHRITGECTTPESSFLAGEGIVPENSVNWVNVAGKGSFARPDDPSHTEQFLDGTHTSMSRADFEALWAKSNKILLRRCTYCADTHRYVYLKRYDDDGLLPANVDLLNDVKKHWFQYENNIWQEDFELFSTYDDAVQDKDKWLSINSDYQNLGFARDSGPDGYVYNQWNVWEEPLWGKHYGQRNIGFFVAMPVNES